MTENSPQEPLEDPIAEQTEEDESPDRRDADEARDPEVDSEVDSEVDEDPDADEIERELLDAMKKLRGANKNVEQYLDGLARDVEKPAPEQAPGQNPDQVEKPAE